MAEMRFDTARHKEQLDRMRACQEKGLCYFCERVQTRERILADGKHWVVIKNDYEYPGSIHHYLIVSKRHIFRETELFDSEWLEKLTMLRWLENYTKVPGFSEFCRNGNMMYTHASLDHLHFHFLSGIQKENGCEKIKVTLGYKKGPR
jgi:diadenosine tetraphosphate (Ap4A) HIT family hydrolase